MTLWPKSGWPLWLVLAVFVRLLYLTDKSVWIDEAYRITWAKGQEIARFFDVQPRETSIRAAPSGLRPALRVTARHYPPLYTVFYNPWMRVFGDSDESLRVLAVLFGVLAVVVTWLLARTLFSEKAATWAAMLAALGPFQVEYSQEIGQYSLAVLLVLLSMLFVTRYAERRRPLDAALWAGAAICAFYAHYSTVLVVAGEGLALCLAFGAALVSGRRAEGQRVHGADAIPAAFGLVWPAGLMLAGVLPSLGTIRASMSEVTFNRHAAVLSDLGPGLSRGLSTWWLGEQAVIGSSLQVLVASGFGVLLVWLGTRSESRLPAAFVTALAALPVVVLVAVFILTRNEQLLWPRYFVLFGAGFPVFAGAALARLPAVQRAAAATVFAGGMAMGLWVYFTTPIKRPWREVASIIEQGAAPGEAVLVHLQNLVMPLAWYMKSDLRLFGIEGELDLERQFAVAVEGRPGVWLVLAWAERSPATHWLTRKLDCRFEAVERSQYFGVELARFSRPRADDRCRARATFAQSGDCVIDARAATLEVTGRLVSAAEPGSNWEVALVEAAAVVPARLGGDRQSFAATVPVTSPVPGTWLTLELRRLGEERPFIQERCLVRPQAAITTSGPTGALSWLDQPQNDSSVFQQEPIHVGGWIFASGGVDRIDVLVDGELRATTHRIGVRRDDVTRAFPAWPAEVTLYSGFSTEVAVPLQAGDHRVEVVAVTLDGGSVPVGTPRTIHVLPHQPSAP